VRDDENSAPLKSKLRNFSAQDRKAFEAAIPEDKKPATSEGAK
jgi:hypothetical protein